MGNKEAIKNVVILLVFICGFVYFFNKNKSNSNSTKDINLNSSYYLKRFIVVTAITILPAAVYFITPSSVSGIIRTNIVLLLSASVLIGLIIYNLKK